MYVMNRVLKDNKVVQASSRNKVDAFIEFMVQKMDLILSAPEDILIKVGEEKVIFYSDLKLKW